MQYFRRLANIVSEMPVAQFLGICMGRFDRMLTPVSIAVFIALIIGFLIAPGPEDVSWPSDKITTPAFKIYLIQYEPASGAKAARAAEILSEPELFQ